MLKIFFPTEFQNSDTFRMTKIFNFLVLGLAVVITTLLFVLVFTLPQNFSRWISTILVFDLFTLFLFHLSRKGYLQLASFFFIGLFMTLIFVLSWTGGGIEAGAFRFIPVLILAAGLVLGWRKGIYTGIISVLGALILVLADIYHVLPVSVVAQNSLNTFFNYTALISILVVLQYVTIANLDTALAEAREGILLLTDTKEDLRKSEAFRKRVFESSRVPIVVMDALSNKYIDCNQAAVDIYKYSSREEILGKSPIDFSAPIQYDGISSVEKAKFYIQKAQVEGSIIFEWRHQRPDGVGWDAEVHLMSFETDNQQFLQFTLIDITERKRIKNALLQSQGNLSALIESTQDLIWSVDYNFDLMTYNKALDDHFQKSYGTRAYTGAPTGSLISPERASKWRPMYQRAISEGPYRVEYTLPDMRVLELAFQPIMKEGEIVGVSVFGKDITDRKRLEEALSESEEKFHTLFENASDSIFLMESDKFIDCNTSTLEMFGCITRDQLIGHSPMEFSPELQFNGRDSFDLGWEKIKSALSGQKQFFEWIHQKLDGTQFPVEVGLNRVEIGGRFLLQAIVRDISERKKTEAALKESEGKLRAMFESSRDAIGVSKNGVHVFANSSYLQLFGFESNEQVIGKPILESIALSSHEQLIHNILHRSSGKPAPTFYEARGLKVDGTEFDAEFSVSTYELNGEIYSLATIRDITERKLAEEKLKQSEERFRLILENMPILLNGFDENGNFIVWNKACEVSTGYSAHEIIGNPKAFELLYPNPEYRKLVWNASLDDDNCKNTYDLVTKNGEVRTIEWFDIYHYLNIPGWHSWGLGQDITERKQAEGKLRDSEERYRTLFENAPIGIFYSTVDNKIIRVNDEYARMMGYASPEEAREIVNRSSIGESIYAKTEERSKVMKEALAIPGKWIKAEKQFRKKDGTLLTANLVIRVLPDNPGHLEGFLEDITDRKKAEEELLRYKDHLVEMVEERTSELEESRETFRALAENTKDVITRVNEKFQFLYVNSALRKVFDIPVENYFGKSLGDLNFPQKMAEGFENIINNVFQTKQTQRTEFQLPNGIWADLMAMPEYDIKGNVCSVIISARDITELKKLQFEIEESLKKEKELNQLKNRFMSMVSHEYRTPLTSILSSIEILEMKDETYTKEKKKTHFNRIQKNIDYLVGMIDEVLYVNRIDSNRVEVSLKSVDLTKFCVEIFDEIKELYPEIMSVVSINLRETHYNIDETILKKILGNLISNAYKYNRENGEVNFSVKSENDKLIFNISDTGIGIPKEEQKNVFEPFSRMTNTQNIKGTGLGLSIVKKSVEQLEGNVSFTSRKDEGSAFQIILPIK